MSKKTKKTIRRPEYLPMSSRFATPDGRSLKVNDSAVFPHDAYAEIDAWTEREVSCWMNLIADCHDGGRVEAIRENKTTAYDGAGAGEFIQIFYVDLPETESVALVACVAW